MKFYAFDIGDYIRETAHLEELEDLAYRRMIDLYYITENPLCCDATLIARKIRMPKRLREINAVLAEFFIETEAGWVHRRCEKVIAAAREASDRARENGKKGGRPRKPQPEPGGF